MNRPMSDKWDDSYQSGEGLRWHPETALCRFLGQTYGSPWPFYLKCQGLRAGDIGCGNGRNFEALWHWGFTFCGIDKSVHALDLAQQRLRELCPGLQQAVDLKLCSLPNKLPWPDASMDLVIDCQTMQHLNDRDHAFIYHDIARVLKAGGHLWSMHWRDGDAKTLYAGRYPELATRHIDFFWNAGKAVGLELIRAHLSQRGDMMEGKCVASWFELTWRKP